MKKALPLEAGALQVSSAVHPAGQLLFLSQFSIRRKDGWNCICANLDFFVLCTPIADAGILLDFPLRLIFGIRMLISEIAVWALAITINVVSSLYFAEYYETTKPTMLLHAILTMPYPY